MSHELKLLLKPSYLTRKFEGYIWNWKFESYIVIVALVWSWKIACEGCILKFDSYTLLHGH